MSAQPKPFWNSYVAGAALGLVLLSAFLLFGRGLGASGAVNRVAVYAVDTVAPTFVDESPAMGRLKTAGPILDNYFVYLALGVLLGGGVSAYAAGRTKIQVMRGPRISVVWRIAFAIIGGIMMGFAAKLSRGCTSGQALSGGALLSAGAWMFMFSVFGGGYIMAWFMRRQWT